MEFACLVNIKLYTNGNTWLHADVNHICVIQRAPFYFFTAKHFSVWFKFDLNMKANSDNEGFAVIKSYQNNFMIGQG